MSICRPWLWISSAVALAWITSTASAQTLDDFYSDAALDEIRLSMEPADWQTLQAHYLEDTYYPCDWQWRGITVKNAGVRAHGHGSRNPVKPALEVKFNHYTKSQKFLGVTKSVLKNSVEDASFLRDPLSFKVNQRMGLPYVRVAYARLYINNSYQGLYQKFEDRDDVFLQRTFGEINGYLYDFKPLPSYHFEYLGADPTLYTMFELQNQTTDLNPSPLVVMIQTANQASDADFQKAMAQYLDWNQLLMYVATEDYLLQNDGFLSETFGMNNFDVYRPASKTVHVFFGNDQKNDMDYARRDLFADADANVLTRRALNVPELKNVWLQVLLRAAAVTGGPGGWLDQEAVRLYNQVHQAVLDDPNKQYSDGGILKPITNDRFESEVAVVRSFIQSRGDIVRSLVTAAGFQFPSTTPNLSNGGIGNAGVTSSKFVAPGSLASAYGTQLGSGTASASSLPLPTTLAGGSIYVNGFVAPLVFVSPGQVNLQIPWEIGLGSVPVTALVGGVPGNTITASVGAFSPGIFIVAHADGSVVSADRPAAAGETLVVYGTGLGPLATAAVTGQPAPSDKLVPTATAPVVTVGGQTAQVAFAGLTPGFVGLYQINIVMPSASPGTAVPLVITIGGESAAMPIATR